MFLIIRHSKRLLFKWIYMKESETHDYVKAAAQMGAWNQVLEFN